MKEEIELVKPASLDTKYCTKVEERLFLIFTVILDSVWPLGLPGAVCLGKRDLFSVDVRQLCLNFQLKVQR